MLYVRTAKKAVVPLAMAVWLPTFLSSLFTGHTVERETYASMMQHLNRLPEDEPDRKTNVTHELSTQLRNESVSFYEVVKALKTGNHHCFILLFYSK